MARELPPAVAMRLILSSIVRLDNTAFELPHRMSMPQITSPSQVSIYHEQVVLFEDRKEIWISFGALTAIIFELNC
jgi:hypothetical protein